MAEEALEVQEVAKTGLEAEYKEELKTEDTYTVGNDGRTFLHFKKTGAGACTVTIATPRTVDGLAVADVEVEVPAEEGDVFIGPFPRTTFNSSGSLSFTVSEVTGLTVAALKV